MLRSSPAPQYADKVFWTFLITMVLSHPPDSFPKDQLMDSKMRLDHQGRIDSAMFVPRLITLLSKNAGGVNMKSAANAMLYHTCRLLQKNQASITFEAR
jgi:hypothetical protein